MRKLLVIVMLLGATILVQSCGSATKETDVVTVDSTSVEVPVDSVLVDTTVVVQ